MLRRAVFFPFSWAMAWAFATCGNDGSQFDITTSFGTKSLYKHPPMPPIPATTGDDSCAPVFVYALVRHGTRAPSKSTIKRLAKLQRQVEHHAAAGADDEQLLPALATWRCPVSREDTGMLLDIGSRELFELGRRTRAAFPDLLAPAYHPSVYNFRSSEIPRASMSGNAFAAGLFYGTRHGSLAEFGVHPVAIPSTGAAADRELRFHKLCARYKREVKKNSTLALDGEFVKFKHRRFPEIARGIAANSHWLRVFPGWTNVTAEDVLTFWEACRFETAWLRSSKRDANLLSPWCALFTSLDAEVLEMYGDLETHALKGHANARQTIAAPLLPYLGTFFSFFPFSNPPRCYT